MRSVDIIVMGKTGTGKSTLINAVLEENVALTGRGMPVSYENKIYRKEMILPMEISPKGHYEFVPCKMSIYDTVGLEIDSAITEKTLNEISIHVNELKKNFELGDISVVWFCVSEINKRFEVFEWELIKKLSHDYEIPFVVVITQSISKKIGELEKQIKEELPNVSIIKVLAKDYPIDEEISVPSWGVKNLLRESINDYPRLKVGVLEEKMNQLDVERQERINEIDRKGRRRIHKYSKAATKIGILPMWCVPIIHGICVKMLIDLHDIVGIKGNKAIVKDIFANTVLGWIVTPFMNVPLLSIVVAQTYVKTVGESYLKVLLTIIDKSSDKELKDASLMKKRIEEEIRKIKK